MAAAEKKAKDLVARARKGERFAEMARDNSDSVTAKSMGELWTLQERRSAIRTWKSQVWNQPKGYMTDPIPVKAGFEILRVEDHQKAGQAELSEVENEIMDKLLAPRMQPTVRELSHQAAQGRVPRDQGRIRWIRGAAPGKDTAWVDPAQLKPETVTKEEVASQSKRKKLLWMIPVPGTQTRPPVRRSKSRFHEISLR